MGVALLERAAKAVGAAKLHASLSEDERRYLQWEWKALARPEQLPPPGNWRYWLALAGRGWGKTRTGAEWVRDLAQSNKARRIALVAPTAADVRDIMVEGESGILSVCPPWFRPRYYPSKRRVVFPNGVMAICYSADKPDRLRGPQHHAAWVEELASWRYPDAWDQLQFGLRLGDDPRCLITTTPKPKRTIRDLIKDPATVTTGGSTYDNRANLAQAFLDVIIAKYEGTTLGAQEIHARLLEEVPGALWTRKTLEENRIAVADCPKLKRIVVAIDPSVTGKATSDEAGIVCAGLGYNGHGYVLDDHSLIAKPLGWARKAVGLYHAREADRLIAEKNNGGDMVELTIKTVDDKVPVKLVWASRGKITRAEPIAALDEQGKVHHVGMFDDLEDELCNYDGDPGADSPNRMDARVWALSELMLGAKRHRATPPSAAVNPSAWSN